MSTPNTDRPIARKILAMSLDGLSATQIAAELKRAPATIRHYKTALRNAGLLPRDCKPRPTETQTPNAVPTREEIEAMCKVLRERHLAEKAASQSSKPSIVVREVIRSGKRWNGRPI